MEIQPTKKTPHIIFEQSGVLKITGRSFPEDAKPFYLPLLKSVDEYKKEHNTLKVVIDLEHFNTQTAKMLLELFRSLEEMNATIIWVYEEDDEDMLSAGQDYESMIRLPFEFKSKPVEG